MDELIQFFVVLMIMQTQRLFRATFVMSCFNCMSPTEVYINFDYLEFHLVKYELLPFHVIILIISFFTYTMLAHGNCLQFEQPFANDERPFTFFLYKLWLKLFTLCVNMHFLQMLTSYILIIDRM